MDPAAATVFLEKGILGAIIVVLSGVIIWLYKDLRALQEKRIAELREHITALNDVANKMIAGVNNLAEVVKARRE